MLKIHRDIIREGAVASTDVALKQIQPTPYIACEFEDSITSKISSEEKGCSFLEGLCAVCIDLMIFMLTPLVWIAELCNRFDEDPIKVELELLVKEGNSKKAVDFSKKMKQVPFLRELLDIEGLPEHFCEIFKGANVKLSGDKGYFYNRWLSMEGVYPRASSHRYQEGKSHALSSRIFSEFLFWIDEEGDTRFQLERHSLQGPCFGIFNKIAHLVDYLTYKRDHCQQGPFGTSLYTEDHCLKILIG